MFCIHVPTLDANVPAKIRRNAVLCSAEWMEPGRADALKRGFVVRPETLINAIVKGELSVLEMLETKH